MRSKRQLQEVLQDIEKLNEEIKNLASGCEFAQQRRLCLESQALLQSIHDSLEEGFANLENHETFTGFLDRI